LFAQPSLELLGLVRRQLGNARPLYIVRESMISWEGDAGHAGPRPKTISRLLEPLFENNAIGIYRVREP
jgi:hypothetical protein